MLHTGFLMNNDVRLNDLFDVGYGTKFDLKQMQQTRADDPDGISFVSRSRQNLGVAAYVKPYKGRPPLDADLITVSLGGSYLLSAFVQERPFYTAQNVAVLTPKADMPFREKLFYCLCLSKNRFRYSAFGREANRTLSAIEVPAAMPASFEGISLKSGSISPDSAVSASLELAAMDWKEFKLSDLFDISGTQTTTLTALQASGSGTYPYVTTKAKNNGVGGFYDRATEKGNALVIDSAVLGYCSYQQADFSASDHVEKLTPRFSMNQYIALFLTTVMNLECYRYSYGRKASQQRLRRSDVRLPATEDGRPDWQFMESFIKTMPYSSNL